MAEQITATEVLRRQKEVNNRFNHLWKKLNPFERIIALLQLQHMFKGLMGFNRKPVDIDKKGD